MADTESLDQLTARIQDSLENKLEPSAEIMRRFAQELDIIALDSGELLKTLLYWQRENQTSFDQFLNALKQDNDNLYQYLLEMRELHLSTQAAANAASGAVNYEGDWATATGAATQGHSYSHNGSEWTLLVDLDDITTSEPSSSNGDWRRVADVERYANWSTLSGAKNAGLMVDHNGQTWILKQDVEDITAVEPTAENVAAGVWVDTIDELKAVAIANGVTVDKVAFLQTGVSLTASILYDAASGLTLIAWDNLTTPYIITSYTANNYSGYDVVTDQDTFEFVTPDVLELRNGGACWAVQRYQSTDIRGWGCVVNNSFDNSPNLLYMTNKIAPYEYQGTIAETTSVSNNVKCAVKVPIGMFRITEPWLISPYMIIDGLTNVSFDNKGVESVYAGSCFVADFDGVNKFAIDNAPWYTSDLVDQSGASRVTGAIYAFSQIDGGYVAASNAIELNKISVVVPDSRNLRGCVNLTNATRSKITNCGFVGANSGYQISASFSGECSNNFVIARAIGVYKSAITIWRDSNNYITIDGTVPEESTEYVWPSGIYDWWGDNSNDTCCYYGKYDSSHTYDNTYEGGVIGEQVIAGNFQSIKNYMERITGICYAHNTIQSHIQLATVECDQAELMKIGGADDQVNVFDFAGSSVDVASIGRPLSERVKLVNFYPNSTAGLTYNSNLITDFDDKSVVDIYVTTSGSDDNWGYTEESPMLTIQGALERCKSGARNRIHLEDGATISTKYDFLDGTVSNRYLESVNVEIIGNNSNRPTIEVGESFNEIHALSIGDGNLSISGVNIDFSGASTVSSGQTGIFIKSYGNTRHTMRNVTLSNLNNNNISLCGCVYENVANMAIVADNFIAPNLVLTSNGGGVMTYTYTQDLNSSLSGGQAGNATVIYSNASF